MRVLVVEDDLDLLNLFFNIFNKKSLDTSLGILEK